MTTSVQLMLDEATLEAVAIAETLCAHARGGEKIAVATPATAALPSFVTAGIKALNIHFFNDGIFDDEEGFLDRYGIFDDEEGFLDRF